MTQIERQAVSRKFKGLCHSDFNRFEIMIEPSNTMHNQNALKPPKQEDIRQAIFQKAKKTVICVWLLISQLKVAQNSFHFPKTSSL